MSAPALPEAPTRLQIADVTVPERVEDWLGELRDLDWLHVAGRDASRLRIVSVLLHGNEPSSIRALHRLLRRAETPATDVWFWIGAVEAARRPPVFSHRFLPEDGDLNRHWWLPAQGPRAAEIERRVRALRDSGAEALLDVHNNTGHNPPYGVGSRVDGSVLGLVSLFGVRFVHSTLPLGTLVEAAAEHMPSVTIECGRAGDPAADDVAFDGLGRFLALDSLRPLEARAAGIEVLEDPVRVTVRPGADLRFDHTPHTGVDLVLDPEIDRHNFQLLEAGTPLGWLRGEAIPLDARDGAGADRSRDLFRVESGRLVVANAFIPVMMTTDPRAALADCLFYVVKPRASAQ